MDLIAELRQLPCMACGTLGPSDIHHVKTRGSGGKDDPWNVIPLCRYDHSYWHQVGPTKFFKTYPHVKQHLIELGWQVEPKLYYATRENTTKQDS